MQIISESWWPFLTLFGSEINLIICPCKCLKLILKLNQCDCSFYLKKDNCEKCFSSLNQIADLNVDLVWSFFFFFSFAGASERGGSPGMFFYPIADNFTSTPFKFLRSGKNNSKVLEVFVIPVSFCHRFSWRRRPPCWAKPVWRSRASWRE